MKLRLIVLVLFGALLAGVVSPGVGHVQAATPQTHVAVVHNGSHAAAFDKTRFVAHLAVAAFLVHYIYKKYKEGKLGRFHIFTDLKAAAAGLIAYHELKVAYGIAKSSNSKTLQLLVAPINGLTSTVSSMASKVGHGDTSKIPSANTLTSTLASVAAKNGFGFSDQAPSGFKGF